MLDPRRHARSIAVALAIDEGWELAGENAAQLVADAVGASLGQHHAQSVRDGGGLCSSGGSCGALVALLGGHRRREPRGSVRGGGQQREREREEEAHPRRSHGQGGSRGVVPTGPAAGAVHLGLMWAPPPPPAAATGATRPVEKMGRLPLVIK